MLVQVPLLDDDELDPKQQAVVDLIAHERQRVALRAEFAHRGGRRAPSDVQPEHDRAELAPRAETMSLRRYLPIRAQRRVCLKG